MNKKERIKLDALNAIKRAVRYPDKARLVAEAIVSDICDRRGIKHAWEEIDQDTQYSIVDTWEMIINTIFDEYFDVNALLEEFNNKKLNQGDND